MHRVLIADPDRVLAARYRAALEQGGFETQAAASGLECLARLRAFRPHVLVLEPDLPWGAGEGVLALLREDESLPGVSVVVVSARAASDGLGGQGQVRGHFQKPLEPRRLVGIVREVVPQAATS